MNERSARMVALCRTSGTGADVAPGPECTKASGGGGTSCSHDESVPPMIVSIRARSVRCEPDRRLLDRTCSAVRIGRVADLMTTPAETRVMADSLRPRPHARLYRAHGTMAITARGQGPIITAFRQP